MASILPVVGVLLVLGVSSGVTQLCEDDTDCKHGLYCFSATHNCVQCVECSEYRRHNTRKCVKEPLQCGECLDGYELEILSDGVRDVCVPTPGQPSSAHMTTAQKSLEMSSWLLYGAICTIGVSFAACAFFAVFKLKNVLLLKHRTRFFPELESTSTSSSALYAPSAPAPPPTNTLTAVPKFFFEEEKMIPKNEMISGYVQENKCNDNLQMAGKFISPSWVRNSPDDHPDDLVLNNGGGEDDVDGPIVPNQPAQDFLIDEETLPSEWTPGPDPGPSTSTSVPLITSFSGILSLNEATGSSAGSEQSSSESANHNASSNVNQINVTNNITVINSGNSSVAGVYNNFTKT
ncbi:uncharacterized protein LOC113216147 [Frankliniella occidentalis]|uniref:Uncharacterized protein LOC113216147 n=1 Tax=Frankliniella occidentalis TaxID=133901 RepID=A0A9C6WVJ2_FRAOC|nr:uncharacterized protein LOC113216147 [Frankliniella occidentalis]